VVDDLGLKFEHVPQVRQAIHQFIDAQMQQGDLVAILRTGVNIGALQQFTTDKRKLHAAAESIRSNAFSRTGIGGPGIGTVLETAAGAASGGTELDSIGRLAYVIGSLREMPGHKSVLLLAETNILPMRRKTAESDVESTRIEGTNPAMTKALDVLLDQATRSSASIYTIDSSAEIGQDIAEMAADAADATGGRIQSMIYLSNATGGKFVGGLGNDLSSPFSRAMEDQQGYYLLAYTPDPKTFEGPGKERRFHKITVRVTRPGYSVRSNSGFLGSPDQPAPKVFAHGMLSALASPFGSPDIELGITSVFFDEVKGPTITTLVNVNAADLTITEGPDGGTATDGRVAMGRRVAEGEIVVAVFGENGDTVYKNALGFTARLRESDFQRALANGFLFTLHLPMKKPGPYDVRVAVRDKASGKIGTASSFLEVPAIKKNRVTVSGILLQTAVPAEATQGMDLRGASALRVFHPGETINYAYQILNPKIDGAARKPKIEAAVSVYKLGKLVYRGKPAPVQVESSPQRVPAGGSLNIGPEITPGDYVLQVDVTDLAASAKNQKASQYIDFYVR
jgi:VWFA-related protein